MKRLIFMGLFFVSLFSYASQTTLDSLKNLLSGASDSMRVELQVAISQAFIDQNVDSALHFAKLAEEPAKEQQNSKAHFLALNLQGNCAQRKGEPDSAMVFYEKAKAIAIESQYDKGMAIVLNNIGIIQLQGGEYEEALKSYFKAIDYEKIIGDKKGLAEGLNNIGVVHYYMGDMENTLVYLKKSMAITRELGELRVLKKGYNNIGAIHRHQEQYEEAIEYYQKALEISEKLNDKIDITAALHNLADVYQAQENFAKAEELYFQTLALREESGDKKGIALDYLNLGSLYRDQNEDKKAEKFLYNAIQLATEGGFLKTLENAYEDLSDYYAKKGQFQKALELNQKYILIKDSLVNADNKRNIAELRTKYETVEKEKLLAVEKSKTDSLSAVNAVVAKEKAEAELKTSQRNVIIIVLFALGLLGFFITMARMQQNKRRAQAEKDAAIIQERDKGIQAVFSAQEEERKRISKDLHDGIGQQLSGLKMAFQKLSGELKTSNPEKQKELDQLSSILHESADDVRSISHQMMPRALTELGIVEAINDMLEKSLGNTEINYEFEHFGIEGRLDEKIEVSLYRISQELINNIIKHSEAQQVQVQLFKNKGKVILIVEDNGKGINTEQASEGHGLLNIKSRLNSIHGEVNYEPSPTSGTIATVRIPL